MRFMFENTSNTRPILENSLKFIRSDVPTRVSEEERQWMLANDIVTIVDLRTSEERARKVCPLAADERFSYHCMPVTGGDIIPQSTDMVAESYIAMADARFRETIDFLLNAKSNVLYFCNAGKDRTGVVSAVLLHTFGMKEETIIGDYMKSKENLRDMLEAYAKQNPSVDINVITPQERYIKEFLAWYARS